ncbi:hypothetical protein [Sphingomonas faeni]|uniref:hypothetical protein n=1 Tax=Sphingomonas faeni TaxID=185950 RepID=UPI0033535543
MRKTLFSLVVAASALTAATANAQGAPAPAPGRAALTRADAIAQATARFVQMDANHDGLVSATEMQDYRTAMHDRRIARGGGDRDREAGGMGRGGMGGGKDGGMARPSITQATFEARAAERFDRTDTNHDGVIDATERANRAEMRHLDRQDRREGKSSAPAPGQ